MNQVQQKLLMLIAAVVSGRKEEIDIGEAEWNDLLQLGKEHAVLPLIYAEAKRCSGVMPQDISKEWFRVVVATMIRNENLLKLQDKLMALLEEAQIPCAILKGSSHSVYYPDPNSRPLGDIDLLVRKSDMEKVAALLNQNGFHAPETDHPFHVDFYGQGGVVEVHYAVSTFPQSAGGKMAEKIMSACLDDTRLGKIEGHRFPMLSPVHLAMNQLLHMERHMTTQSIGLRQLCDWVFFVSSVSADAFRNEILPVLRQCGLERFAQVLTKTCILYLHLDSEHLSWCGNTDDALACAMITDIFRAGNINSGADSDDMSDLLVDRTGKTMRLHTLINKLTELANHHFPYTRRFRFLLPLFWIYIPLRYVVRTALGLRPYKNIGKSLSDAGTRNKLYRELALFDTSK